MRTIISMISLAALALTLANCNTMQGAGKDIKAGGKALENSAAKNKSYSAD